jgi:hypothetical protein
MSPCRCGENFLYVFKAALAGRCAPLVARRALPLRSRRGDPSGARTRASTTKPSVQSIRRALGLTYCQRRPAPHSTTGPPGRQLATSGL